MWLVIILVAKSGLSVEVQHALARYMGLLVYVPMQGSLLVLDLN